MNTPNRLTKPASTNAPARLVNTCKQVHTEHDAVNGNLFAFWGMGPFPDLTGVGLPPGVRRYR